MGSFDVLFNLFINKIECRCPFVERNWNNTNIYLFRVICIISRFFFSFSITEAGGYKK